MDFNLFVDILVVIFRNRNLNLEIYIVGIKIINCISIVMFIEYLYIVIID